MRKKSVETVKTVETAGDVEQQLEQQFEAIEAAGDVEVKEAEGK